MKGDDDVPYRLIKNENISETLSRSPSSSIFRNHSLDFARQLGDQGCFFINQYYNQHNSKHVLISSKEPTDVDRLIGGDYQLLISVEPINNLISINEFFGAINNKLEMGGIFICRFTPQEKIEEKLLSTYFFPLNHLIYFLHFIFRRVFPKLSLTRNLYFRITKGKNRSIRELEMMGRLSACGYEFVDEIFVNGCALLVARKQQPPFFDKYSSYGLLFKMKRIGKGGKEIFVYKLRTMVPFSEYLQEQFISKHRLAKGGKINNDYRITPIGRILRKFWIDEIPNLINLLKGEMKLVGVRPISQQYLSLYKQELQELRQKVTPGIIPPFYVDLPETLSEIQESEKCYINSYLNNPFSTDCKYLFLSLKNILTKRICSK